MLTCATPDQQPGRANCPNCGGHLANIGSGLRECEQCGFLAKNNPQEDTQTMQIDTREPSPQNPAATPQPMPTAGRRDVLPEVIADLQSRDALGRQKYGTTLQTHNGRDPLMDAYQEQLDHCMYLKQALMERGTPEVVYNWPAVKFSQTNSQADQFAHILSEIDEINEIGPFFGPLLHMELADLHHSIETYWRIAAKRYGQEHIDAIFQAVENKNRARGYYDIATEAAPCPGLDGPYGHMPYGGGAE
ncbi:hypothetical protein [Syntrophotalea acetylenica]|uniref:Ferritin-like domain-containing protein n=1 Tax=Syntrophotalea acetylenica TaxID=29542 RepID=A0A1L3GDQ0_SYNAC|nr:hypothetical protein [Syntrophotalea acetylenica]APG24082.1 hypothetical protein A7E75_02840 [Syntrophotalea acetylenica]APG44664.1 hypothetical protein A6070_11465 [Syntrophotalea acetylenica]